MSRAIERNDSTPSPSGVAGPTAAAEELLPLVYDELRKLARVRMARERPGHTLQPTALVHEAYLRLVASSPQWANRAHFFAAAAEAMRRILIERARRIGRHKRGGGQRRITLAEGLLDAVVRDDDELLALDQALRRLESRDPAMAQVVSLRCFAGLTVEETASALDTSERTVKRLWTAGRAWLHRELTRPAERPAPDSGR